MAQANVRGADFWEADLTTMTLYNIDKYWIATNLNTRSEITAAGNNARPGLVEAAREQRRMSDIQRAEPRWLLRWWNERTNLGANFWPVAILFLGVNLLFACIYYFGVQQCWPHAFMPDRHYSFMETLVMALLRSITTNAIAEPNDNTLLAYLFFFNGFSGVVVIGLFVAQITKLFVRSS